MPTDWPILQPSVGIGDQKANWFGGFRNYSSDLYSSNIAPTKHVARTVSFKKRVRPLLVVYHRGIFYAKDWTKEQDVAFVNMLAWQAELGFKQTNPNCPNRVSLNYACSAIDVYAETSYPREFYLNRLDVLRRCFNTFRRILDEPGFTWNEGVVEKFDSGEILCWMFEGCDSFN
ncbi:UNVERIFIED_CONTAM: hypothetical protein Slati_2743800 [Sesamum latifolium]|uniref:Myb/SANT-like domain-containing protein n=1 Tax=Sesamum latifolium TaxID=2727402 RepID=A0AAW2VX56_9LAMI